MQNRGQRSVIVDDRGVRQRARQSRSSKEKDRIEAIDALLASG
jgi:hypothetical protein